MWFEAHDSLPHHPKTLKLARLMDFNNLEAVGLLWMLFDWGLVAARKDGNLPGMEPQDIAMALGFPPKKADKLVEALVGAGYLDHTEDGYAIHDWYDYAGKLMDKRESDRKRKAESHGQSAKN